MNSKLSNKSRINAKPRKKHCSFIGWALQISPMELQNRRTTAVLTNSIVTAKPMNNAQQRGGKDANSETCRRNGRTEQATTGNLYLNLKTRRGPADHEVNTRGWG